MSKSLDGHCYLLCERFTSRSPQSAWIIGRITFVMKFCREKLRNLTVCHDNHDVGKLPRSWHFPFDLREKCDVTVYCLNLETSIHTLRVSGYPLSLWSLVCEILKNAHVCFQFNVLLETIVIRRCDAIVPLPFTATVFTSGIITARNEVVAR